MIGFLNIEDAFMKNPVSCHKMCCSHAVLRILPTNQLTKNINFCRKRPVSCHKMCCSHAVLCILPTNQLMKNINFFWSKTPELP
ncbi:hypothetical protein NQZ68_010526 [Dissostichus eleginoides]|nr:hypothetical protein NQZ68_010526 [Dissostichus eleginoides]